VVRPAAGVRGTVAHAHANDPPLRPSAQFLQWRRRDSPLPFAHIAGPDHPGPATLAILAVDRSFDAPSRRLIQSKRVAVTRPPTPRVQVGRLRRPPARIVAQPGPLREHACVVSKSSSATTTPRVARHPHTSKTRHPRGAPRAGDLALPAVRRLSQEQRAIERQNPKAELTGRPSHGRFRDSRTPALDAWLAQKSLRRGLCAERTIRIQIEVPGVRDQYRPRAPRRRAARGRALFAHRRARCGANTLRQPVGKWPELPVFLDL